MLHYLKKDNMMYKSCGGQLDQCMLPSCVDLIVDRKVLSRVFVILTL